MENFNLLVLHTIMWRWRWHRRDETRGCTPCLWNDLNWDYLALPLWNSYQRLAVFAVAVFTMGATWWPRTKRLNISAFISEWWKLAAVKTVTGVRLTKMKVVTSRLWTHLDSSQCVRIPARVHYTRKSVEYSLSSLRVWLESSGLNSVGGRAPLG